MSLLGPLFQIASSGVAQVRLAKWKEQIARITILEQQFQSLSDPQLRETSLALRYRAKSGEPLAQLLPDAFALVRTAAQRAIGMRHFDVQLLGGIALFHGAIAEMQTGEGKTLTATLPLFLRALPGKGAHLATVNDYLAERDAQLMRPVFALLGLRVGVVKAGIGSGERRAAYACDITYGTAKEFGFDFLRDRLLKHRRQLVAVGLPVGLEGAVNDQGERPVQRDSYFALVDEADSVLIDDARTPLVISALPGESELREAHAFNWAAQVAPDFQEPVHYKYQHDKRAVELSFDGRQLVRALPKAVELDAVGFVDLYTFVERAIKVLRDFHLNQHYIVRNGEIVIVDESTGRVAEGRKWSRGIHQAVEAKERVEVTVDAGHAARVTVQDFFLRYEHLAGMTGTAITSAHEFSSIYRRSVIPIPTHRPPQRRLLPDRVFAQSSEKWQAIVDEITRLHARGQPVLVGTRTIDRSEHLSRLLRAAGIPHAVLNAHRIAEEAEIVAQAGQRGKVTVATNMAGRGTDVKLGDGVAELGGLHVICTELHDSARIDRQLCGRCGRQGDPGAFQTFLSLDDDVLTEGLSPNKAHRIRARGLNGRSTSRLRGAQRQVEGKHYRQRRMLLYQERQIKKMHREMGQDPYLESPY
jgi:preprotein translocase subunit SecA